MEHKFFPLSIASFLQDFKAALKGHLAHDDLSKYNMVQKLAYLLVILDVILLVLSGLVVWKSVQFPLLRELMGDYDNARVLHFYAMSLIVLFIFFHLVIV